MRVGRKTHKAILNAYYLLKEISDIKLPAQTAYDLFKLVSSMEHVVNFRIREEQKLLSAYQINGDVDFGTLDDAAKILSEINDLDKLEEDIELEKPTVKLSSLGDLSVNDISALNEFLDFLT